MASNRFQEITADIAIPNVSIVESTFLFGRCRMLEKGEVHSAPVLFPTCHLDL